MKAAIASVLLICGVAYANIETGFGLLPAGGFRDGRAPVVILGRSGYIDTNGRLMIYPLTGWAQAFCGDGRAPVGEDKPFLIDTDGRIVFQVQQRIADNIGCFSDGRIELKARGETIAFSDATGKLIVSDLSSARPFKNGLAPVQREAPDSTWWYINRQGKAILGPFDAAEQFSEGLAVAGRDGKLGYIDRHGRFRVGPSFVTAQAFSGGCAVVSEVGGHYKFIDRAGGAHTADSYTRIENISEGVAAASRDGGSGFIDSDGSTIITFRFEGTSSFSEGLAAAARHGLWGYIDHDGEWVIPPTFRFANAFSEGKAAVYLEDHVAFIDKQGHVIWDQKVAEKELSTLLEQKRQIDERENSIPFDDPLESESTDELVRRLIEGDFRVIPTIALRLTPDELSAALLALPEEQPEYANDSRELLSVPGGKASNLALAVGDSGAIHVILERNPAIMDEDRSTNTMYRQRDEFGRWLDLESVGPYVAAAQGTIVPLPKDELTVFTRSGSQIFKMTRDKTGSWSARQPLLTPPPKLIGSFDTALRPDGRVDLLWLHYSSDTPFETIGYGVVGKTKAVSNKSALVVADHFLSEAAFLPSLPRSIVARARSVYGLPETEHEWIRSRGFWKHQPIALSDRQEFVVDASIDPREAMTASWLGSETEFSGFADSTTTHICFPAPGLSTSDEVGASVYDGKPVVAVAKGAFTFLLRDEGGATTALLLARTGEQSGERHLVIRGDRAIVTFAIASKAADAVRFAEIPLRGAVWTPVERLYFRADKGVGLSALDIEMIVARLKLAARQMEWQHHAPRSIALYDAVLKYRGEGDAALEIFRLCQTHRSLKRCEQYRNQPLRVW